jgi:DNA-binding transcriptional regulator YiaG
MNDADALDEAKRLARGDQVVYRRHARIRMRERGANELDVISAIVTATRARYQTRRDNWILTGGVDRLEESMVVIVGERMTTTMTRCVSCKKENTLCASKERFRMYGVELLGEAIRCNHCGEVYWPGAEVKRQETEAAAMIVARGIRNGKQFQFIRKMLQLKATDLAALLDVRPETISRWERGEYPVDRAAAFVLGELYDRPRVVRAKLEALAAHP